MTFYSLQSVLYYLEPKTMLLRKAQIGAIKQDGDRTYQLNENYRWERINRNIGRTVRKLERQRDVDKLRWIEDRMDGSGLTDEDAMYDAASIAASRIENSREAREGLSTQVARKPKKLRAMLESELAKPKPKIGILRRIAKLATEGSDAMELVNEILSENLFQIAQDATTEADLRQEAQEIKRNKGEKYEFVDGHLRSKFSDVYGGFAGIEPYTFEQVTAFPEGTPLPDWAQERYKSESDPWIKQAILKQVLTTSPVLGAIQRENMGDEKGDKFYRFSKLPDGKFTAAGGSYAYQQISESELTPKERQLLSGQ